VQVGHFAFDSARNGHPGTCCRDPSPGWWVEPADRWVPGTSPGDDGSSRLGDHRQVRRLGTTACTAYIQDMLVRVVLLLSVGILALAAWDALEKDGAWGRQAGQVVEQTIHDVLHAADLS
jgi:hypothetical protein